MTGNAVEIGPFAVATDQQRKGIGGKLLDVAEDQAEVANALTNSLRKSNIAMYTKRGYRLIKEVPVADIPHLVPPSMLSRNNYTVLFLQKASK